MYSVFRCFEPAVGGSSPGKWSLPSDVHIKSNNVSSPRYFDPQRF